MAALGFLLDLDDTLVDDRGATSAAARLIGVPVERCVMVGDDPARDIEPARALGMRAHRVERGDPAASILAALDGG